MLSKFFALVFHLINTLLISYVVIVCIILPLNSVLRLVAVAYEMSLDFTLRWTDRESVRPRPSKKRPAPWESRSPSSQAMND